MEETQQWHVYGTHVTCAMLKLNCTKFLVLVVCLLRPDVLNIGWFFYTRSKLVNILLLPRHIYFHQFLCAKDVVTG
jgi:hypothetical protein